MTYWPLPFEKDKADLEGIQKRLSKISNTGEDSSEETWEEYDSLEKRWIREAKIKDQIMNHLEKIDKILL